MDIYVAGPDFRPDFLIESYEAFIWTDRFAAFGDFKLVVKEAYYLGNLRFYNYLVTSASGRVMMIESVSTPKEEDGESLITISGRSIEAFLMTRSSKSGNLSNKEPEVFGSNLGEIARYIVHKYCVDPGLAGAVNVIPNLTTVPSTLGPWVNIGVARGDVYTMVKAVCDAANLGFMMFRSDGGLIFMVYQGLDKSLPSTQYYRIYSADTETFINTSSLESIANYKNHARVLGVKTGVDVYAPGTPSNVSGFDRRTLIVEASDIGSPSTETDPAKQTSIAQDQAWLAQRGIDHLNLPANKYVNLIDGDIPPGDWNDLYFSLGDIVMAKDTHGVKNKMQITEQIWSIDGEGEQYTPTMKYVD